MQINMSELFAAEGIGRSYETGLETDRFQWNGGCYPVRTAPICLSLLHVGNGRIAVTGTVSLCLTAPCDRCLEPVEVPLKLLIDREIDTGATDEERIAALDEQPFVQGYLLDVDRLIYDELIVNMPDKVLCRPDCKGICPVCGADRNLRDCGCESGPSDLRMSAIRDIFNKSSQDSR